MTAAGLAVRCCPAFAAAAACCPAGVTPSLPAPAVVSWCGTQTCAVLHTMTATAQWELFSRQNSLLLCLQWIPQHVCSRAVTRTHTHTHTDTDTDTHLCCQQHAVRCCITQAAVQRIELMCCYTQPPTSTALQHEKGAVVGSQEFGS
jgi:hypothetical protein